MPETMRAVLFHEHGGREKLRVERIARPEPGPGEVLVRIRAASVNHLDVHTRRGIPGIKLALPHVPGSDGAGEIAALGAGVEGFRVGERVVVQPMRFDGTCEFCRAGDEALCVRLRLVGEHTPGTYCEYRALPVANVMALPHEVSYETAAAAFLVYQTAWRMAKRARVAPGDIVLVLGASGGVGSACVDVARHLGARVFATAGTDEKCERTRKLGAELVINYEKEKFWERVREVTGKRGVDVVMDQIGAMTYPGAIRSLRRGGRYVTCGATTGNAPPAELHYVFWNQLEVLGSTMASLRETREVADLLFAGTLKPTIDSVLPLEEAAEAHRRIEEREHFGKIVLRVD